MRRDDHAQRARALGAAFGWCSVCGGEAPERALCTTCAKIDRLMVKARARALAAGRVCVTCEGAAFTVGFEGFQPCEACGATGIQDGLPLVPTLTETVQHASLAQMNAERARRAREDGDETT